MPLMNNKVQKEETLLPLHTSGPVDGSLYATVAKSNSKTNKGISFLLPDENTINGVAVHTTSIDSGISSTASTQQNIQQPSPKMSDKSSPISAASVNVQAEIHSEQVNDVNDANINKDNEQLINNHNKNNNNNNNINKKVIEKVNEEETKKPMNGNAIKMNTSEFDEVFDGLLRQIASITEGIPNYNKNNNETSAKRQHETYSKPSTSSILSSSTGSTVIHKHDIAPTNNYNEAHVYYGQDNSHMRSLNRPTLYSCPDEIIDKRVYHTRAESRPFSYGVTSSSPLIQRRRQYSESTAYVSESRPTRLIAYSRNDDESDVFSDYQDETGNQLTWLQRQQQKLRAKREGRVLEDRQLKEQLLIAELSGTVRSRRDPLEDLSRESSPVSISQPIHVHTNGHSSPNTLPIKKPIGNYQKQISAPTSPITPTRVSSKTLTLNRYPQQMWSPMHTHSSLYRQRSEGSCDRDRPFVAIKKVHQLRKENTYSNGSSPDHSLMSTPAYSTLYYKQPQISNYKEGSSLKSQSTDEDYPVINQSTPKNTYIDGPSSWSPSLVSNASSQGSPLSQQNDRPNTPNFPVASRTPYVNQDNSLPLRKAYSPSPVQVTYQQQNRDGLNEQEINGGQDTSSIYYGQSRRSSMNSLNETEMVTLHPMFVKDTSKYWYKPKISRDDAINYLKDKQPGTFIIRDSISFPGAFGLVLKVASPPANIQTTSTDLKSELVRHFLIEPTSKGVQLKGCANEPVFSSLSTLVYQHSVNAMALPCKLILPEPEKGTDIVDGLLDSLNLDGAIDSANELNTQSASCNVLYLLTVDTETLTGPEAVKKSISELLQMKPTPVPTVVHFKVTSKGITLTDNNRRLFFRRHYTLNSISHCGLDPDNRKWSHSSIKLPNGTSQCFGFVARKAASKTDNQCHIFAEYECEQPANAIVTFVNKLFENNGNIIKR